MSLINQMLRDLEARLPKHPRGEAALKGLTAKAAPTPRRTRVIFALMVLTLITAVALLASDPKIQRSLRAAIDASGVTALWRGAATPRPTAAGEVAPPAAPPATGTPAAAAAAPTPTAPTNPATAASPAVATATAPPTPTADPTAESRAAAKPPPEPAPEAREPPAPPPPGFQLTGIELIRDRLRTRLVLGLDGAAPYRVLRNDGRGLTVELERTTADQRLPPLDLDGTPLAAVERESRDGKLLLHLDFKEGMAENRLFSLPTDGDGGTRIVIDLFQPPPPKPKAEVIRQEQRDLCLTALNLARMEKLEEAEYALDDCLKARPRDARARAALAALLINGGRLSEAQPLLAEGLRIDPSRAELARLQARLQINNGSVEEALTSLRSIPSPSPADHAFIAALEQRANRHREAVAAYRRALAEEPHQGTWWLGSAISLEALNRPGEATEAYRRAGFDPRLPPAARGYAAERLKAIGGAP